MKIELKQQKMKDANTDTVLQSVYTTIFSQKYSPDGNNLAVCSNFGEIALYDLPSILSIDAIDKLKLPYFKFKAHDSCLYSLESANDYLICGAVNEIVAWNWNDLTKKRNKKAFSVRLPVDSNEINTNIEINSLCFDSKSDCKQVYAACGNGDIYCVDLEYCKITRRIQAHKDCVYQIALNKNSSELFSASEDGEVKLWDLRTISNSQMNLKPFENEMCARPEHGRFISCLAVDDDNWLICGGGPKLAMWHLRSTRPMNVLDQDPAYIPNTCILFENQILTGGNKNRLYSYSYDNKLKKEIITTPTCVYDISINYLSKSNKVLCIAGSGSNVDLCINFSYKSLSLRF